MSRFSAGRCRSVRTVRALEALGGAKGRQALYPAELADGARAVRGVESDASEFDHNPADHSRGKHIIDRGGLRFYVSEGRYRGPLALVGAARHLAVAARARWNLLRVPAGFYRARPSLAVATVG